MSELTVAHHGLPYRRYWSEAEVATARQHGCMPVAAGPRILRTEAAAVVALAPLGGAAAGGI